MTPDDLEHIRFNTPLFSTIDGSTWYYDHRPNDGTVKIFKELLDTTSNEIILANGRSYFNDYNRWNRENPWEKVGELSIPMSMFMEDFELVYKIVEEDIKFVKKVKYLMEPYSLVKPNFHMIKDLPF